MRQAMIFTKDVKLGATDELFRVAKDLKFVKGIEYVVQGNVKGRNNEIVLIDENGNFVVVHTDIMNYGAATLVDSSIQGNAMEFDKASDILKWYLSPHNIGRATSNKEVSKSKAEEFIKRTIEDISDVTNVGLDIDNELINGLKNILGGKEEENKDMTLAERIKKQVEEMIKEGKSSGTLAINGISKEEMDQALKELEGSGILGKAVKAKEIKASNIMEDILNRICDCENCDDVECDQNPRYEEECEEEVDVEEECDCNNCDQTNCPSHPSASDEDKKDGVIMDLLANFGEVVCGATNSAVIKGDLISMVNTAMDSVNNMLEERRHTLIERDELEEIANAFDKMTDELEEMDIENEDLLDVIDNIGDYISDLEDAKDEVEVEASEEIDEFKTELKNDINKMIDDMPEELAMHIVDLIKSFQ